MSKEAMKLALEALEEIADEVFSPYDNKLGVAILAINEALAEQPAQQQEPVATVTSESGNPNVSMSWWHEPALPVGTKLYTSPPAQRTWVGLTEDEVSEIIDAEIGFNSCWGPEEAFARAIEAKLKEKNT